MSRLWYEGAGGLVTWSESDVDCWIVSLQNVHVLLRISNLLPALCTDQLAACFCLAYDNVAICIEAGYHSSPRDISNADSLRFKLDGVCACVCVCMHVCVPRYGVFP